MTIEYLCFICFVGRLHLDHSALSSSSFMKSSFLIQMIRWIRGSLRIEFFIFLIAWGIFFEWWELDLQLLPSSSSILMSRVSSSSAESNHFLLAHIPRMNESHDLGRLFKVAITTTAFFTSSFTYFFRSSSDVCSFLKIAWSRNHTSLSVSLGKTITEQVDPWLNQQWPSWPWPSYSGVRLWGSSPSRTRTSLLM